jgi:mono/diheme cytochrome c family protein
MRRVAILCALVLLAACREDDSLAEQPKFDVYSPSDLWPDGAAARPLVAGTVARGALARAEALATPPPVSPALLQRGRERFEIFCTPCHGFTGQGDGRVVQRGFPPPPSYLSARLRAAPAQHFVDVITHGYGVMASYGDRVDPVDRWAITAYIRALQVADPTVASDLASRSAVPVGGGDAD